MSNHSELHNYPSFYEVREKCKGSVPGFVWDYFDSATGNEISKDLDRRAFDEFVLEADILRGEFTPDPTTVFFDNRYSMPVGIAPVGLSGLIYPEAEKILAATARKFNIPYCFPTLSTVAFEDLPAKDAAHAWFQLYCTADLGILEDLLNRAWQVGMRTLVVTVDLPGPSVRERQIKSGLTMPPTIKSSQLTQLIRHPVWSCRRLFGGTPKFANLQRYSKSVPSISTAHQGYQLRVNPDIAYIDQVRRRWEGKIILKGISAASHLEKLSGEAVDAFWVSMHGGRQFQGGRSSIDTLRIIREKTDAHLIFDGGVMSGGDVIKSAQVGADLVFAGKAFHYSLGAFGAKGPEIACQLFRRDIVAHMHQMGMEGSASSRSSVNNENFRGKDA